jgi:hypothetical protein
MLMLQQQLKDACVELLFLEPKIMLYLRHQLAISLRMFLYAVPKQYPQLLPAPIRIAMEMELAVRNQMEDGLPSRYVKSYLWINLHLLVHD